MNSNHQHLSIATSSQMDLLDYLSSIGYQPAEIRSSDYWYLSPLRDEKTRSFKVNRKLNSWYDRRLDKCGNLIDFSIYFHNCPVPELLQKLEGGFSFQQPRKDKALYGTTRVYQTLSES